MITDTNVPGMAAIMDVFGQTAQASLDDPKADLLDNLAAQVHEHADFRAALLVLPADFSFTAEDVLPGAEGNVPDGLRDAFRAAMATLLTEHMHHARNCALAYHACEAARAAAAEIESPK